MQKYKNLGGCSPVAGFEAGDEYIVVLFHGGLCCLYTYNSAGADQIEQMKLLAHAGRGLNAFIEARVKHNYGLRKLMI